ncbi:S1 family peptidase [Actinoplanes couchii]|uniref:Esterase n=1 Tax=Actinoplanes couchii TaxID=403638 RepID=A0ABQ3XGH6_9ACTN|nr:secreted trypsin-like serine protease [Actinoplanes couchii]GID57607.1 esterase [Actinoplanes couchii]
MIKNLTVLLAVLVTTLAFPRPAAAIANGEDARDGDYRFSVLLTMTGLPADDGGTRDSSCSGALIAPRWVITAGHCFRDADGRKVSRTVAEKTTAVVGRSDLSGTGGQEAQVVDVHQADDTDVALAELSADITGITPIRLSDTPAVSGETLRLTGFGLVTDASGLVPATRMQTGLFTVNAVGDTLVEASGTAPRPDTSPCPHDSGGPYFRETPGGEPALVAVVSTGPGCPHPGPDFSARVDTLAGWIADTTSDRPGFPFLPLPFLIALPAVALALVALLVWQSTTRRSTARQSGARRSTARLPGRP